MEIRKATRSGIRPLIALYSESGCGKTYSALLLARGLAGPKGKIVMAETENGRGELYSDVPVFGGYDVLRMDSPFSPASYVEAIQMIEKSGAACGILDSGSHEWEGQGGVLDMAADNEERSKRPGLHNWKTPKFEHAKFVSALMRSSIPWIVCLRAKFKTRQGKDDKGKTAIIKDEYTSPIQAEDFIFEATCHGEIMPNHHLRLTKWSHPGLKACFPEDGPIEIKHGEAIAKWCVGSTASTPAVISNGKTATEATRTWALQQLAGYENDLLMEYFCQKGWLAPDDQVTQWPLDKVPTSKPEVQKLMQAIEVFRDTGNA